MKRHAILFVPLLLAAGIQTAHAQAVSQAWNDYRKGQETPAATPSQEPALPAAMEYRRAEYERHGQRDRGGFFIGAQAGKGWVYEDVDQNALSLNAGYRWQAGPVSLLGLEVAAGRLADTSDDGWYAEEVKFRSIGFNGRFNFGARNPWYAVVRAGYFDADMRGDGWSENMDGGYAGFGIGVVSRVSGSGAVGVAASVAVSSARATGASGAAAGETGATTAAALACLRD